jgi:hypothetical protein
MQKLKIDVTKIDKTALFVGAKGIYMDLVLIENRDGTDQYGNDGFISQEISKDRRDKGEKGTIIGNWKHVGRQESRPSTQNGAAPPSQSASFNDEDEIPF